MIQITKDLIAIEVPRTAYDFDIPNIQDSPTELFYMDDDVYKNTLYEVELSKEYNNGKYEIIGLIETPELKFEFDVDESWVGKEDDNFKIYYNYLYQNNDEVDFLCDTKEESFRTLIKKKIEENGKLLVNPYEKLNSKNFDIYGLFDAADRFFGKENKYQKSESKVIKGNLLIVKII